MELQQINLSKYLNPAVSHCRAFMRRLQFALSECDLCQQHHLVHPLLCEYCQDDLAIFDYQNLHGDLLNWPAVNVLFPDRSFDRLLCIAPYIWPFDQWLKQLKYQHRFELADLLAYLLINLWQEQQSYHNEIAVISVPSHIKKWQRRGYNQAHLLAKKFAEHYNLPYFSDVILRKNDSGSQVGLTGKQRRKNLKKAYALTAKVDKLPNEVILLDDVVTTGTTVNSICQLLKQKGVQRVTVLAVALTLP